MPIRVLLRDGPERALALGTETHVLIFKHSGSGAPSRNPSSTSVNEATAPKCVVEFSAWEAAQMQDFRSTSSLNVQGTLGLVTINNDVFLCVVSQSSRAATLRPGETVQRILGVEFHCLNRPDYDHLLLDQVNPFPADDLDADGHYRHMQDPQFEHPCMALKKLLSGGSFYYSADFDLTKRLQDRPTDTSTVAIDSLDAGFLWNAYMIQPLVDFRSRLSESARLALDESRILTSAIRGFALTVAVPPSSSPARSSVAGMPSNLTLISRLSCRRAGTRFNARGIDDDGNVANFVETETIYCTDSLCFSYVQIRGSVPLFWEQASGLPGQQKVTVTRSMEATQHAFDKHFETISRAYGDVFVVNLLSEEKPSEIQLTRQYFAHIERSTLNARNAHGEHQSSEHKQIQSLNYDFHAETRGPNGYEAASGIKRWIADSAHVFDYYLSEEGGRAAPNISAGGRRRSVLEEPNEMVKQAGVFRTNCMDCLDRTNLVQTIISQMAIELFIQQRGERSPTSDFWARHGMLWADCGDALSKIYAGTGALKSSFTRHGKMSLAGAIADVRKSAQRLYINNFEDKGRQNTIDMLLGRLIGQIPVHLYDPVYDYVTEQLARRAAEYTSGETINIWVGTFNVNGKADGLHNDLTEWLCPKVDKSLQTPEIVAVAFQEIVELSPQQIMSTDPYRRQQWEDVVRKTLNEHAENLGSEEYVLLRGGQLVGASLSVFVKASVLPFIKNVEGAVKKQGMSGMAGNKGAVAIRMEYADTPICLVTAHLAAGFANYQERNQDYQTISSGLRFQRNRAIHDHQTIIWFGDFNYRIGMSNERARQLIEKGDLGTLYENDQLNLQMVHGKTFQFYAEKTPTFAPTYKYNLNSDLYDTSDKARIPAWCDRILTKGDNLQQLYYEASPLRFSDHRPVWGLFQARISVVDQKRKDAISAELYSRRKTAVTSQPSQSLLDTDSETSSTHAAGYTSGDPEGLPPASSDRRKWWLDHGQPARSALKPANPNAVPNPSRPANPFTQTAEPDWVTVSPPSTSRTNSSTSLSQPQLPQQRQRTFAPPPTSVRSPQPQALDGTPSPSNLAAITNPPRPEGTAAVSSFAETAKTVHLKQTLRKPAPAPKPKPESLRDGSAPASPAVGKGPPSLPEPRRSAGPGTGTSTQQQQQQPYFPPPPRRATGESTFSASSAGSGRSVPAPPPPSRGATRRPVEEPEAPTLPPRRGTGSKGLMDDDDDEEIGGLGSWEALKPG